MAFMRKIHTNTVSASGATRRRLCALWMMPRAWLSTISTSISTAAWKRPGTPAVAVRRTKAGHDVFVGVPQLTPELVHALAGLAGVHCYTRPGPALWAANGYLSVQALTNGVVRFDTGRKGPVTDALDGKAIGAGPEVELKLEAGDVRVLRY
jgi:hypothetical protein